MTTRSKTTKPDYCVFDERTTPMELVGIMSNHKTGPGYTLTIGDDRYTVVPPRTTQTATTAPDLYVFMQHQCRMVLVGAGFKRRTGRGYNLSVKNVRYTVVPPRSRQVKPEPEGSA